MPTWLIIGWAVVMLAVLGVIVWLTLKIRELERDKRESDARRERFQRLTDRTPRELRRQPKDAA
jgi:hypothetical protein